MATPLAYSALSAAEDEASHVAPAHALQVAHMSDALLAIDEDFLTLYCDPGEDFGWCVGKGLTLVSGGTHKMWEFGDLVWEKLNDPSGHGLQTFDDGAGDDEPNPLSSDTYIRDGLDPALMKLPIKRIVCEDFRIYPWKAKELSWDPVRTARIIGALTFMARLHGIPMVLQGAKIKKAAQAAGAEEYYYRPLRPNRHQNDAIQHFVFFTCVELLGLNLPVPDTETEEDDYDD